MRPTKPTYDVGDGDSDRRVEVSSALSEQAAVIANLFELYAYDLSQEFDLHVNPDGRYGYRSLPLYWEEASRFPFLIKVSGYLAGFVLVTQGSLVSAHQDVWDMAELFVLKRYRRRGVGTKAAQEIWRRFPGRWEVRVLETNEAARMFWDATICSFTGGATRPGRVEHGGKQWLCFAFDFVDSEPAQQSVQPDRR